MLVLCAKDFTIRCYSERQCIDFPGYPPITKHFTVYKDAVDYLLLSLQGLDSGLIKGSGNFLKRQIIGWVI